MTSPNQSNLQDVDWSAIPPAVDDGAAAHLPGARFPSVALPSTKGGAVDLAALPGRTVLYAYPMTGRPGVALPQGWDDIPGARGCTPQSCSFRDHHRELLAAGADHIFGLSVQDTGYQREAAERLHLPFPLLSDASFAFSREMHLPYMTVAGMTLLKRMALIADDGCVVKAFYPVFPPDRNGADVLEWLKDNPR